MRDLVVFLLFVGFLPYCFLRPWIGLLVFSFLAYNRTQDLTWGFARSLPISQSVAIALLVGWMVWEFRPLWNRDIRMKAMLGLWLWIGVSMFSNTMRWDYQWHRYTELGKVVLLAFLTTSLLINRERLRQIALVVLFALGFYGVKNGLWFMAGQETIVGPGGMLKDNNDFALAMVMALPFMWYMRPEAAHVKKWGRFLPTMLLGMLGLTMLAIMATGSRGGFLSMSVTIAAVALKSKFKVPAIIAMGFVGIMGLTFAPQEYKDRLSTITLDPSKMDGSAQGRIVSWMVAGNMIKQKPITGIGFNNMVFDYHRYVSGLNIPFQTKEVKNRVAHNSYFQIWAESGTPAYVLYMFMVLSTIVYMKKIEKASRKAGETWVRCYTSAVETTLYGFLTGATFLNRAHFDLVYQLVAIGAAIPTVIAAERAITAKRRRRGGARVAHEVWVRHKDPFVKVAGSR